MPPRWLKATTIQPIWANASLVEPTPNISGTLSVCGPGYTHEIMGYFLVESKSKGFHITPYKSVSPSADLTENVSGIFQPFLYKSSKLTSPSEAISFPRISLTENRHGRSGRE